MFYVKQTRKKPVVLRHVYWEALDCIFGVLSVVWSRARLLHSHRKFQTHRKSGMNMIMCEFAANWCACHISCPENGMLSLSITARSFDSWGLCLPTYRQTFRHQASDKPKPDSMWFFPVGVASYSFSSKLSNANQQLTQKPLVAWFVFPSRSCDGGSLRPRWRGWISWDWMGSMWNRSRTLARPKPQEFGLSSTPILWRSTCFHCGGCEWWWCQGYTKICSKLGTMAKWCRKSEVTLPWWNWKSTHYPPPSGIYKFRCS